MSRLDTIQTNILKQLAHNNWRTNTIHPNATKMFDTFVGAKSHQAIIWTTNHYNPDFPACVVSGEFFSTGINVLAGCRRLITPEQTNNDIYKNIDSLLAEFKQHIDNSFAVRIMRTKL